VRTLRLALAATLTSTGCINAGVTVAEMTTEKPVETRAERRVAITEPRVATTVAAMGSGTIALEEDSPGLMERATVADANARVIALQRMPGGSVVEAELEEEDGRLVYSYEIRVADGRGKVEIDATTAAVLRERRKEGDDRHGPSGR
jgi:hypothetical protein